MCPSVCRKASPKQASKSSQLPHLPWDILLEIASQCRIDELLALRLVSTQMRCLITCYMSTIAPSVARATFPHNEQLPKPLHGGDFTLFYLQELITRQLAIILIDRHRIGYDGVKPHHGIPAEAPQGDYLRGRVARGWHVLWELANISRSVHTSCTGLLSSSPVKLAQKTTQSSQFAIDAYKLKEEVIQQRRLDYIGQLAQPIVRDYIMLTTLLPAVFSMSKANVGDEYEPWIFDQDDSFDPLRSFRDGESWLSWFVLAEGPKVFWAQWWSLPPESAQNYVAYRAISTYKALDPALIDYQRALMKRLHGAIREQGGLFLHDFGDLKPRLYFPYIPYGKPLSKKYRVRETLEHVPFLVKFRCPGNVEE